MKTFRIYYKTVGVTTKRTPFATIEAESAEKAVEIFKARRSMSFVVAIFAE